MMRENFLVTPTGCTNRASLVRLSRLANFNHWSGSSELPQGVDAEEVSGLWVRQDTVVSEQLLKEFPKLRFVATTTTSTVHIDSRALSWRNITLINLDQETHGLAKITSTVDHTWALILHAHGNVTPASKSVFSGDWNGDSFIRSRQLSSLKLGVIGLGRIGMQVAEIGQSFGMEVWALEKEKDKSTAAESRGILVANTLSQIFEQCDYVTLHASSDPENFNMVSKKILNLAKGVRLFNTARGELVDESGVVESLRAGVLKSYSADVAQFENARFSLGESILFRGMREGLDITLTPHVGGSSADAMAMAEEIILDKIADLLA